MARKIGFAFILIYLGFILSIQTKSQEIKGGLINAGQGGGPGTFSTLTVGNGTTGSITIGDSSFSKTAGSGFTFNSSMLPGSDGSVDNGSGSAHWRDIYHARWTRGAAFLSEATKFTVSSGCATISNTAGGATAGQFNTTTTGVCSPVIVMDGATGITAPTGWSCWVNDITSGIAGSQSDSSTTGATLKVTTTSGDLVSFGCIGY